MSRTRALAIGFPTYGVLIAIIALASAAAAIPPEPVDDRNAIFSLERARREQQRDGTAAATFRADLPWAVGEASGARPYWLRASAGPEWDERPLVFSNSLGPPNEITRNGETGGVWFVDGGTEVFRHDEFSGGLAATYWGSSFSDVDYDTHYPSLAAWLDWNFGDNNLLRMRYDFGYSWVDGDEYATTHVVGPRYYHDWGHWGVSEFRGEYYDYDFHDSNPSFSVEEDPLLGDGFCVTPPTASTDPCSPMNFVSGDRRDRSGWGFILGGDHRVPIETNDSELRGGYRYQHYIPDGAEFHNQSHELWIEGTTALPFGAVFNANVTFLFRGMRNLSAFPKPGTVLPNMVWEQIGIRRKDTIWRTYAAIARPLASFASVSVEYGFTDQDSNHDRYDFRAHRVGGYVTLHLN